MTTASDLPPGKPSNESAFQPTQAFDEQTQDAVPEPPVTEPARLDEVTQVARVVVDRRASVNLEKQHQLAVDLEERRFRYWLIKVLVLCFCTLLVIVVGAMVYAFTTKGTALNDSVLKNFLETLTEILKVLKPDKPA
jgi:hypothetical protein